MLLRYKKRVDWHWVQGVKVGSRLPNNWGFYDMLGNGMEMTLDTVDSELEVPIKYEKQEIDPLRWTESDNRFWVIRNYGRSQFNFDWSWCGHGFRTSVDKPATIHIVIGPDLMKEKGYTAKAKKR